MYIISVFGTSKINLGTLFSICQNIENKVYLIYKCTTFILLLYLFLVKWSNKKFVNLNFINTKII